jgi:hypothetical protein
MSGVIPNNSYSQLLVTSTESFFCRIRHDYAYAKNNSDTEGCLYGLVDTVFGAICNAANPKDPAKQTYLTLHPQGPLIKSSDGKNGTDMDALPKVERTRRIPDFLGVVTSSSSDGLLEEEHGRMGFWKKSTGEWASGSK